GFTEEPLEIADVKGRQVSRHLAAGLQLQDGGCGPRVAVPPPIGPAQVEMVGGRPFPLRRVFSGDLIVLVEGPAIAVMVALHQLPRRRRPPPAGPGHGIRDRFLRLLRAQRRRCGNESGDQNEGGEAGFHDDPSLRDQALLPGARDENSFFVAYTQFDARCSFSWRREGCAPYSRALTPTERRRACRSAAFRLLRS